MNHPLAALFPLMTGAAFEDLRADIARQGLMEPIVTYEGMVLDGRNRLRACVETDTPPMFREWNGSNPLAFVLSANLHRRHLDESQRAMVAATLANLKNGPRREHSRKPDEFYNTVRRVSPGPRLDMFSREPREGFDQYGIEHDKFDGDAATQ